MASNISLERSNEVIKNIDLKQKKQIRALYTRAYKEITEKIKSLEGKQNVSSVLGKQQLIELRKKIVQEQNKVVEQIKKEIEQQQGNVIEQTLKETVTKPLKDLGIEIGEEFSSVKGEIISSIASGKVYQGDWTLSKSLWKDIQKKQSDINKVIAQGLAENKGSYEIAKDLEKYVDPAAKKEWQWSKVYPGTNKKIDYNAQRLARTMVSHAYQQSIIVSAQGNPFVKGIRWLASNNHDRTCELCKKRAKQNKYGLGPGVYPPDKLPMDHPNGLCTYEIVQEDLQDISKQLFDWAFGKPNEKLDNWFDTISGKQKIEVEPNKIDEQTVATKVKKQAVKKTTKKSKTEDVLGLDKIELNEEEIDYLKVYFDSLSDGYKLQEAKEILKFASKNGVKDLGSFSKKKLKYMKEMFGYEFKESKGSFSVKKKESLKSKVKEKVVQNKIEEDRREYRERLRKSLDENESKIKPSYLKEEAQKLVKKMKEQEFKSIVEYTGSSYYEMNQCLRGQKSLYDRSIPDYIEQYIYQAYKGLNICKTKKDMVVRRGSDLRSLQGMFSSYSSNKKEVDKIIKEIISGKNKEKYVDNIVLGDEGFLSTTPYSSGGFGGQVNYIIELPKGTKGVYVDGFSLHEGEQEFLLQAGTKFLLKDIVVSGEDAFSGEKKYEVYLQVVGQEMPDLIMEMM